MVFGPINRSLGEKTDNILEKRPHTDIIRFLGISVAPEESVASKSL
jgi:hypothetical protein